MDGATTSTEPLVLVGTHAAADRPGIYAFRLARATGRLAAAGAWAGIANPSFLVAHPSRPWLYAASGTGRPDGAPGSVWALRLERRPLALQPINHRPSGGEWPCHLALDGSGRWLLVSNYGSGSAALLPILADGSLGELADLAQHHGRGPHPQRQEGPHAHSAAFAPDNRFAVVADLGLDRLVVYAFDAAAGALRPHGHADARPGAGPRHFTFDARGRRVYAANELDSTVTVYDYDPQGGALHERQTVDTLPPGAPENLVAEIRLAPSGRRLYVSNRGHDSIAVFEVAHDGRLALATAVPCGGRWPRHFALAPGRRFMLVANQHSDAVSVLPLLAGPPAIGAPLAGVPVPQASCVLFVAP